MISKLETVPCELPISLWDVQQSQFSLGGILLWCAEILAQCDELLIETSDVCFVGDIPEVSPNKEKFIKLSEEAISGHPLIELVSSFAHIKDCYWAKTSDCITSHIIWPNDVEENYKSASYSYLQDAYQRHRAIPYLEFKENWSQGAKDFIKKHSRGEFAVAVHLKNNPEAPGCSNANFPVWEEFIRECEKNTSATFFLVGNELIPETLKGQKNVVCTQDFNLSLTEEMAIIGHSELFLGMATGPCNMAILSGLPCLIFKNPEHDKEAMEEELGKNTRFNFCNEEQTLIREYESLNLLRTEFFRLYNRIRG